MEIAGRAPPEGNWWDWEVLGWDAGLTRSLGEDPPVIVAFEADGGGDPASCLIAAEGVEIRPGPVRREVPGRPDWPGVHLATD
ncbi:hypothetical protein ACH4JZ_21745 [Streptomyces sp. NPDC017615]|uniref:hypothetical protein n=1 Tax=Streptomyces sp. NPDC017615 TaxID=3365003 RepID=UPI0037ADA82D